MNTQPANDVRAISHHHSVVRNTGRSAKADTRMLASRPHVLTVRYLGFHISSSAAIEPMEGCECSAAAACRHVRTQRHDRPSSLAERLCFRHTDLLECRQQVEVFDEEAAWALSATADSDRTWQFENKVTVKIQAHPTTMPNWSLPKHSTWELSKCKVKHAGEGSGDQGTAQAKPKMPTKASSQLWRQRHQGAFQLRLFESQMHSRRRRQKEKQPKLPEKVPGSPIRGTDPKNQAVGQGRRRLATLKELVDCSWSRSFAAVQIR